MVIMGPINDDKKGHHDGLAETVLKLEPTVYFISNRKKIPSEFLKGGQTIRTGFPDHL